MDNETEKSLEDLLRKASLKTPPSDLTDKIMFRIDAEAAKAFTLEPELKKLIRLHTLKTPPAGLTRRIAMEVMPPVRSQAPIILPRTWYAVFACAMLLLVVGNYVFPPSGGSQEYYLKNWAAVLYKLPGLTSAISMEYLAGLVTVCALLTIDFLLRYRRPWIA